MEKITIMAHFLEEFKEVDSLKCPACHNATTVGWGVRTNFQLIHANASNRYEFFVIANEYHICPMCHQPFFFRVDVIGNKPLDF